LSWRSYRSKHLRTEIADGGVRKIAVEDVTKLLHANSAGEAVVRSVTVGWSVPPEAQMPCRLENEITEAATTAIAACLGSGPIESPLNALLFTAATPRLEGSRAHGGAGGRPPGTQQHPNTRAAAVEGRHRWLERMRQAKAAGLIEKIPGGRRARGLPPRSNDRIIVRGQRLLDRMIEDMEKLPTIPDKPPEQQTDSELFGGNFRRSLLFSREVLDRDTNWEDVELLKLKKEVALATQTAAVRIKVAELAPRSDDGVVERLMRRVAAIRRGERVIEIDPGDVSE
jgi:hypothetical protein